MAQTLTNAYLIKLQPKDKPFEISDTKLHGLLVRVQPTGRKTFYYSYRNSSGKKNRTSIGEFGKLTIAQARDIAGEMAADVLHGVDLQKQKQEKQKEFSSAKGKTLSRFLEDQYEPWVKTHFKSGEQTIAMLKANFKSYLDLPMDELTIAKIERWRISQIKRGLKPSTINRVIAALHGCLTKATEWKFIDTHPLKGLKKLKERSSPRVRYLSPKEASRLRSAMEIRDQELISARERLNAHREKRHKPPLPSKLEDCYGDRLSPMITLSLMTGMRRGEIFDVEWRDVDEERQILMLRAETTKNSLSRSIPLNVKALTCISNWKKQTERGNPRLFPSDKGGRLDNVNTSFSNLIKAADIENFHWHDMRHDFASNLVMKGVPLNTVRELCGHRDINTTLIYAHLAPDHKADAVALLED
ncbi:MAG: integrase [Marinomonas primoryensis]|jgi:integrase